MTSGTARAQHGGRVGDGAPARTIIMFQVPLAATLLLAGILTIIFGSVQRPALHVGALSLTLAACGVALLVPWERLPHLASAAVPALDAVAIGMLRGSSPESGLGLLWAFPAMWVGWFFGAVGAALAVTAVAMAYWSQNALSQATFDPVTAMLFPLTIAVLTASTALMARRAGAQRELLQRQSRALQRAVERSRRQESLLVGVLDAVDFAVARYAADGTVSIANEAHHRVLEIGRLAGDDVYAADGATLVTRDHLPDERARRGETFEGELIWHGAPGEDRLALQSTARTLRDTHGRDAGVIVVSRDVTSEELAIRAREDLIASVSHELRTPLTSILGHLELAEETPDLPPSTRRSLQIANRNAERLMSLITDIADTSAGASREIGATIRLERTELSDVVMSAVEAALPRADSRRMSIDTTGVEPVTAWVDPHRFRQVLDNLISNAAKYGHEEGRIDIGCTGDGSNAWVVVRDDGPGIPEQELPRVFDRFFRSDLVRNTSAHGTGLGLAISRDIVRAHGGEITVRSTLGEGTTFVVRLRAADEEPGA